MIPETTPRKYKPRRSKPEIERANYSQRLRKFWKQNPLAMYDRQWRYLRNCGGWADPLTFQFAKDLSGEICPDNQICRSYRVCVQCDAKRANIYGWDGYLCLKCANAVSAGNRLLSQCDEIDNVIKQLKGKIREARQGTKDLRRPPKVPLRNNGKGGGRHDRREESDDGRKTGGTDQ